MRLLCWIAVLLIALLPLTTLVHRNDLGRWETQHSAMAAPDEFSYLLLAENLLHGHGISTQHTVGRDTFYPPGYPLLIAGWAAATGLTLFHVHLLNALFLSIATVVVFAFSQRLLRMLAENERTRFHFSQRAALAVSLLIAALFATNWHVLEGALYVFSEPAFMLATFGWIALALRWRHWPEHLGQSILITLLAIAAWSIRGAGIVCIVTLLAYIVARVLQDRTAWTTRGAWICVVRPVLIVLALAGSYQLAIHWASPEKSLASSSSADNSYTHQLLQGLTKRGTIDPTNPRQLPLFLGRVGDLLMSHLDDFGGSFTPWFRESPDFHFLNIAGKSLAILALLGWLRCLFRRHSPTRLLELYVLFYIALYLVWPFNMTRFWAPILPFMLIYAVDALRQFWGATPRLPAQAAAVLLLGSLLALYGQELVQQLGNYERRLNYVSDALATAAATVARRSPDPAETTVVVAGSDEHFLYAWYLPRGGEASGTRYLPTSPEPHVNGPGSRRETVEELLKRAVAEAEADPQRRLFVVSYFTEPSYSDLFAALQKENAKFFRRAHFVHVYQKEIIVTVWQLAPGPMVSSQSPPR